MTLLFDGNSLYARSFYANVPKGRPVGSAIQDGIGRVLGLLNPMARALPATPTHMLFGWDGAHKRNKERKAKPTGYHEGCEAFQETLTLLFGAAHGSQDTVEADDIVATAACACTGRCAVVSGDKDLQQLQGDNVSYYCLNEKMLLSARLICNKWGVKHPSQVAIALAIIGDAVDLVEGIHGWGHAKVKRLFNTVTPEMDFEAALAVITDQIPDELLPDFWKDLGLTLLDRKVPGVPVPAEIVMADASVLQELEFDALLPIYGSVQGNG